MFFIIHPYSTLRTSVLPKGTVVKSHGSSFLGFEPTSFSSEVFNPVAGDPLSRKVYFQPAPAHLSVYFQAILKSLIICFMCVWLGLELNSAGSPRAELKEQMPLTTSIQPTQRLHSVSGTSPHGAAVVLDHSGPDGWCPVWPTDCPAGSRKRRTWPPIQPPPTFLHPPADSTHGNCKRVKDNYIFCKDNAVVLACANSPSCQQCC